eukprot:TRINITY_DN273_c0_g1_i1.p1 TRINITY_DN273_c0_g1~~TRINITY_DN273_c0_g1_i1.p1  ORF type:complete len:236 (-),score=54.13 TRINITY_DN273_c0_g1_i1:491-1198(-)
MALSNSKNRVLDVHLPSSIPTGPLHGVSVKKPQRPRIPNRFCAGNLGKSDEEEVAAVSKVQTDDNKDFSFKIDQLQLRTRGVAVLEASKGYAADIKRNLSHIKERLMGKLSAVPLSVDALDSPRQSVEMMVKDVTHVAQGMTKDAFQRIKARVVELLPSLSTNQSGTIVADEESDVIDKSSGLGYNSKIDEKVSVKVSDKEESRQEEVVPASKASFMSPTSSSRPKRPFFLRSRL